MRNRSLEYFLAVLFLALLANTGYVAAFSSPTVFYMTNVLGHVVVGAVLAIASLFVLRRSRVLSDAPAAAGFLLLAFIFGAILTYAGNVRDNAWILWSHIAAAGLGVAALIPFVWKRASHDVGWAKFRKGFEVSLIILVALPILGHGYKRLFPDPNHRIVNPASPPLSMEGEGGGPKSPFFPASAQTNVGGIIPSNFFMDSETCGECHKKIYDEWNASSHHFALSITSFTGRPSNTCRTRRARRKAASGAPAVTTMRCFSMGDSRSRSRRRSIRRRLTRAWPAPVAMPSCTSTAPWATTDSPSSTRRCIS